MTAIIEPLVVIEITVQLDSGELLALNTLIGLVGLYYQRRGL